MEFKTVTSDEGVTFTPWTDGWAVGFRIEHPERPTRYIYLNPSGATDTGDVDDSDVFVYEGPHGSDRDNEPVCFINVWNEES